VSAALDRRAPVESVYIAAEGRDVPAIAEIAERALGAGARVFDLGPGIMSRVADTVTPQAVCAVVGDIARPVGELLSARAGAVEPVSPDRLLVICVDVRDPGNLGALIRSAAASGASGIVCCEGTADPFNPKTVRATAGTIFSLPLAVAGAPAEMVADAARAGFRLLATTARDGTDYAEADLGGDVALVLGNEASGLPASLLELVDERITIPMAAGTESLNVAMTGTVLCFEIARRRRLA
jgi:TrmH family RNA methyltransferase